VIDVACGPGNVAAHLAKLRPDIEVVGIDFAAGTIEQARLRVPGVEFLIADCRRIHELGRVFDACAFAFGLSYLTDMTSTASSCRSTPRSPSEQCCISRQ
jgi:ubiquinone/menaquinone biosynthesis C-methylase UbiE